jgi:hypothetical protein
VSDWQVVQKYHLLQFEVLFLKRDDSIVERSPTPPQPQYRNAITFVNARLSYFTIVSHSSFLMTNLTCPGHTSFAAARAIAVSVDARFS